MNTVELRSGIVFISPPAEINEDIARGIVEAELRLIREENDSRPTPIFVDNRSVKSISSEARQIFAETANYDEVDKVAFLGGSVFIRTVSNFVFRMSRDPTKMKFFDDREQAISWLKGGAS